MYLFCLHLLGRCLVLPRHEREKHSNIMPELERVPLDALKGENQGEAIAIGLLAQWWPHPSWDYLFYADVHGSGLFTACLVVPNRLGFHGHLGLYTNSVEIYTIKPFIRNPHCFQSQQSNGMFMLKAFGEPNKECTMYISRLGYEPCDWLIIISYYCYHFETTLWLLVGTAELQSLRMIRHFQIF